MIILRHGKFISGARIFRAGEILPDIAGVQELVRKGMAEIVADMPKKSRLYNELCKMEKDRRTNQWNSQHRKECRLAASC